MRELVSGARGAPRDGARDGRRRKGREAARPRQDDRARALAAFFDDGVFFEIGMHGTQMGLPRAPTGRTGRPPTPSCAASARSTAAWSAAAAYDFTVKGGSIGHTGEEKVTRLRSDGAPRPLADGVAHRLGGRPHRPGVEPPGHDLALRRQRAPLPRAGPHERRRAASRRDGRPRRRRYGVHPGPRRLRADGEGHRIDGARRPAARQGGDGRGHRGAGARRLARSTRGERRRRRGGRGRRRVHRG